MQRLLPALALALTLGGTACPAARADDPPKPADPKPADPKPAEPKVEESTSSETRRTATDEEAKALLEELKAVGRKRSSEVLKALQKWEGLQHPEFVKPLAKLLLHEDSDVALRAVALLGAQKPAGADPKAAAKETERILKDLWKAAFQNSANDRRPLVQGAVVRLHGTWGLPLDAKELDDVESLWRQQIGNPDPARVGALVHVIAYAEATKDKRFCRMLAEQIDEPVAGSVNSPSNPPASWWEARWKSWNEMKPHVKRALTAITGQDFKTTADAKKWFEENERAFGFKW